MKGLLYKDFANGKGFLAVTVFYLFYVAVMIGAVATEFMNASGLEKKLAVLSENYMILLGCILVSCIIPTGLFTAICDLDRKTKWNDYVLALPGGYKVFIAEKYIVALIGNVIAVVVSLVEVFVMKCYFEVEVDGVQIEDVGIDGFVAFIFFMIGIFLIGNAVILPLLCRNTGRWIDIFFSICTVIAIYALFAYVALGDISFFRQENLMERVILWIATHKKEIWGISIGLVGVGIVSQIISYVATVKTYLKYV